MAAGWALNHLQALHDLDTRREIAAEVLRRPRQGVRAEDLARCLRYAGQVLSERGERAAAERLWAELREVVHRSHDVSHAWLATEPDILVAFLDGRLQEAVAIVDGILSHQEELGLGGGAGETEGQRSRALLLLGGAGDIALERLPVGGSRAQLAVRAAVLAHLGRQQEADAIVAGFTGMESDEDASGTHILAHTLEVATLGRDLPKMRALARRLEPLAGFPCLRWSFISGGRLLGAAMAVLGEQERARTYYLQGLEASLAMGNRPEVALVRLHLAELLLEHYPDGKAEAIQHLDFAIGEFREMKMQPSLERALKHKGLLTA